MDDATRTFLRGAYEYIEKQQKLLDDVLLVTYALRKTVRDLGPEAEAIYTKHYLAESRGPLQSEGAGAREALSELIRQLSELN